MENKEIYKLLERQEDNLKELFSAHNATLRAKIETETGVIEGKVDALLEYQKIQNSRTAKLEEDTRIWRLIHRNPKASSIIIGLTLLGFIALFILKNVIL